MKKSKETAKIPENFNSLKAASDFWDNHSLADYWDETKEVKFEVEIKKEPICDTRKRFVKKGSKNIKT